MELVHSALIKVKHASPLGQTLGENSENEAYLRYTAYLQACDKLGPEITAIQKYFPGWAPAFKRP